MIKPTRGRVVLFTPSAVDNLMAGGEPLAAIIAHVHSESVVNLTVFDGFGRVHARPSVTLIQEGEVAAPGSAFAEWMPYQKGQAAKTEAVEKQLAEAKPEIEPLNGALAPHQARVVDEKAQLDARLASLTLFVGTPIFTGLDEAERERLSAQARAMSEYSLILGHRIAAFV